MLIGIAYWILLRILYNIVVIMQFEDIIPFVLCLIKTAQDVKVSP